MEWYYILAIVWGILSAVMFAYFFGRFVCDEDERDLLSSFQIVLIGFIHIAMSLFGALALAPLALVIPFESRKR